MLGALWSVGLVPDGEAGVDATVARMQQLVRDAVQDPRLVLFAQDLTVPAGARLTTRVVEEVVKFVRTHWQFRGDPVGRRAVEFVKQPDRLLSEFASRGAMVGDCDDASVLVAALLTAVGISTRFVVVQRDRSSPTYDHIFIEAWSQGRWLPIDGVALGRELFYRPEGIGPEKRYDVN